MNYIKKIPIRASVTIILALFAVLLLNSAVVYRVKAYTNEEIAAAIATLAEAGYSAAEIAQLAADNGVSATQISESLGGGADIDAAVNQAFADAGVADSVQKQTTDPTPPTPTTETETTPSSTATSPAPPTTTNPANVVTLSLNNTSWTMDLGNVSTNGTTAVFDSNGNTVGTMNINTGTFTSNSGNNTALDSVTGLSVSADNAGGNVTTTVDGHNYTYLATMFSAGYSFLNAISQNDTATAAQIVSNLNATLEGWTNGDQKAVTVVATRDANGNIIPNTYSYGCVNTQNTTITINTATGAITTSTTGSGGIDPSTGLPFLSTPLPGNTQTNTTITQPTNTGDTGDNTNGNTSNQNTNGSSCNNNGICESGETLASCPSDCAIPVNISVFRAEPMRSVIGIVTLIWESSGSSSCTIVGRSVSTGNVVYSPDPFPGYYGSVVTPKLTSDTEFTLTCQNPSDSKTKTVKVQILNPAPSYQER